jgi:hypothetical protein
MTKTRALLNVVSVVVALWLTACAGKFTGGGWIPSACDPDAKATFGFTIDAIDEDGDGQADTGSGEFQLVDQACGAQFHGEILYAAFLPAGTGVSDCPAIYFSGSWESPKTRQQGSFEGLMDDCGEGGLLGPEDSLTIDFYDQSGNLVYSNGAVIGGGNVQYHPLHE